MTKPMTPERWKSITDHYQMAKREGASLHHSMVGDCITEIERLRGLVKSAYFEGMVFGNPDRLNPCESAWANSEACKAVEAK